MGARTFADGGISHCFECGKQLVRIKGGFIFAEIVDPDGHRLRVHKQCIQHAVGHGYKASPPVPPLTDQQVHDMDETMGAMS